MHKKLLRRIMVTMMLAATLVFALALTAYADTESKKMPSGDVIRDAITADNGGSEIHTSAISKAPSLKSPGASITAAALQIDFSKVKWIGKSASNVEDALLNNTSVTLNGNRALGRITGIDIVETLDQDNDGKRDVDSFGQPLFQHVNNVNREKYYLNEYVVLIHVALADSGYQWPTDVQGLKVTMNGMDASTTETVAFGIEGGELIVGTPNYFNISEFKPMKIGTKYYSGSAISPKNGLTDGTYKYTDGLKYSYSKNKNPGTATVTIKGDPEYLNVGTVKTTFKIKVKPTRMTQFRYSKNYCIIYWKKQTYHTTGYQVQYAKNKTFTKGKKTVTVKGNKTTKKKITKLSRKTKYWARVRTYKVISGKKYYSDWSNKDWFKTI